MPKTIAASAALAALLVAACGGDAPDTEYDANDAGNDSALPAVTTESEPDSVVASAPIQDTDGRSVGEARLLRRGDVLVVSLEASSLPPGSHGAHIHETGTCSATGAEPFSSAGDHFNPSDAPHGLRSEAGGHAGDLPNLEIASNGSGSLRFEAEGLAGTNFDQLFDRDGSAIVIHAVADDQESDPSGHSGARIACGVFERL